jgi:hypothetical protein
MSGTVPTERIEPMKTPVIDAVCNLLTPQIVASRPGWTRSFLVDQLGAEEGRVAGLTLEHVELLD